MNDDRASIGIGAMIVFIALILVAAVASTIIIKTAEELQQRAEATGDDTRDEISGKDDNHFRSHQRFDNAGALTLSTML